jgi:hypothetical protein
MEVGQGQKLGCSAKEKKRLTWYSIRNYLSPLVRELVSMYKEALRALSLISLYLNIFFKMTVTSREFKPQS